MTSHVADIATTLARHDETPIASKYGTFTPKQMSEAFNVVADPANWKHPIDAMIPASAMLVTAAAIEFYTASIAKFEVHNAATLKVTADGYYRAVGA